MGKYLKLFETHAEYQTYAQSGDMIKPNVSYCEDNNCVHYNPWTWAEEYLTFVAKESGTFTFTPQNSNVISYSSDNGETWTQGNSVAVNSGDKVMWKGAMTPAEYNGVGKFSATGNFDVQGNAMSLLFGDNYKGQTDLTGKNYAFYHLFYENTKVISAENLLLPATTLPDYCYGSMFQDCTSLTTAPELPAETLAEQCYDGMFRGCTSLVNAPELPAETLASYCYGSIFYGCTSLTTAPELPAETLANGCYNNMFNGCTSLETAPELPATTLASYCYYAMFQGCTSLTTAPVLPAETLADFCYNSMFSGCTSLREAPELPATTLARYCYRSMFDGCTNLNYIKAMFTTEPSGSSPNYYTQNWVNGVAATGTFVKNASATWTNVGTYAVPTGWTIETASV